MQIPPLDPVVAEQKEVARIVLHIDPVLWAVRLAYRSLAIWRASNGRPTEVTAAYRAVRPNRKIGHVKFEIEKKFSPAGWAAQPIIDERTRNEIVRHTSRRTLSRQKGADANWIGESAADRAPSDMDVIKSTVAEIGPYEMDKMIGPGRQDLRSQSPIEVVARTILLIATIGRYQHAEIAATIASI
ncbi:hypothetical protein QMZ05_26675 [Bradyrhizobium sp. INPA03-11B]|uniref:hypothetical protein n=1 Tax=Bradyrhizobium sp. INPA03-11B TaxID=418598 RepID=UPI00338FF870